MVNNSWWIKYLPQWYGEEDYDLLEDSDDEVLEAKAKAISNETKAGYTNLQIAIKFGISERTIQRIRERYQELKEIEGKI